MSGANIETPWPNVTVYARDCGEIDPYAPANAALFRDERAFDASVTGRARWAKPSPEPPLDADFARLLMASLEREAPVMNAMARRVAVQIEAACERDGRAPLLIAVLRAGVPLCALLGALLQARWGPVPIAALSLFHGLGWDEAALEAALREHPNRAVWFVDGWTSGGGVAQELADSFARWRGSGKPDFTRGSGPQLAVLCDPRGKATLSAARADVWVPSSCFTAPETLGFSRGFARTEGELFGVYRFPPALLKPAWIAAWRNVLNAPPANVPPDDVPSDDAHGPQLPPAQWRVHINEVVRALVNRSPREVWLRDAEEAAQRFAPLLHLCALRGVPVQFARPEVADWGALAAARMENGE